jgi:hypothetical protein
MKFRLLICILRTSSTVSMRTSPAYTGLERELTQVGKTLREVNLGIHHDNCNKQAPSGSNYGPKERLTGQVDSRPDDYSNHDIRLTAEQIPQGRPCFPRSNKTSSEPHHRHPTSPKPPLKQENLTKTLTRSIYASAWHEWAVPCGCALVSTFGPVPIS